MVVLRRNCAREGLMSYGASSRLAPLKIHPFHLSRYFRVMTLVRSWDHPVLRPTGHSRVRYYSAEIRTLNIDPSLRPEVLSLAQFAALTNAAHKK